MILIPAVSVDLGSLAHVCIPNRWLVATDDSHRDDDLESFLNSHVEGTRAPREQQKKPRSWIGSTGNENIDEIFRFLPLDLGVGPAGPEPDGVDTRAGELHEHGTMKLVAPRVENRFEKFFDGAVNSADESDSPHERVEKSDEPFPDVVLSREPRDEDQDERHHNPKPQKSRDEKGRQK